MKAYTRYDQRGEAPQPYSVIINIENCTISELTEDEANGGLYRKEIQKIVPNMAWLAVLYTLMESLAVKADELKACIHRHYDQAKWLAGDGTFINKTK